MDKRTAIFAAAVLAVLALTIVVPADTDAYPGTQIGGTLSSEAGTMHQGHTMVVSYYSDGVAEFDFTFPDSPGSEEGRSVRFTVEDMNGSQKGTYYPFPMSDGAVLDVSGFSIVQDTLYRFKIQDGAGNLITEAVYYTGDLANLTFTSVGGTVSKDSLKVPSGTVMTADGTELAFVFGTYDIGTVTAEPPEGSTFDGWYIGSTKITSQSITSDAIIEAKWKNQSVTITFDSNGGSGSMPSQSVPRDSSYTLPSNSFTPPSGKRFSYWDIDGIQYNVGSTVIADRDLTVKAMWYTPSPPGPDPPGPDPPGPDPPGPGPEPIDDGPGEIDIPKDREVNIKDLVEELKEIDDLVWESSDTDIAEIDEDGNIKGKAEGEVTITGRDSDGDVIITVTVRVGPSSDEIKERYDTENDGQVILTYDFDSEGKPYLGNPITVIPGTTHGITEDQMDIVKDTIERLVAEGIDPHVVIPTDLQSLTVPTDLLDMIVENNGSLTVIEGDVTLFFSVDVLSEIGYDSDLDIVVIPVVVDDGSADIDVTDLPNPVVYDIYMLINGGKVTRTFAHPINIVIDYQLEDGQTLDRLSLYYIDVEPFQKLEFEYDSDGVHFDVYHFSHYAISYDDTEPVPPGPSGCCWCWIVIAIIILLLVLLLLWFFLWKRFKIILISENGFASVPEGWKRESDSSISMRMRWKQKVDLSEIDAVSPEDSAGTRNVGWDPTPPEKITRSMELHAVWSDGPVERIGPGTDEE